jgi:hypothetical protein
MWRLSFPVFIVRLAFTYAATLIQLILFRLAAEPLALINTVLTLIAGNLIAALLLLPPPANPTTPELGIAVQQSHEITPVFLTVKTSDLAGILERQENLAHEKPFLSQNDFVNLAVLAQEAGNFEKAQQYYKLARNINPNKDFFTE